MDRVSVPSKYQTKHVYTIYTMSAQRRRWSYRPNVFDVGQKLYKCYTNALCSLVINTGLLLALHTQIHTYTLFKCSKQLKSYITLVYISYGDRGFFLFKM